MAAVVAGVLALAGPGLLADADAKRGKGKAKGKQKIALCHKGKRTIRVGAPALRAHLRHGDRPGACSAQPAVEPGPNQAVLVVFKFVVNDDGGSRSPADFTITISGVPVAGSSSFPGSAAGVARIVLGSGSYAVTESAVPGYVLTDSSADCAGTIVPGQEKTCVLVNDDVPS